MNSSRFNVLVVLGTKAQFIKTAPVLLELDRMGVPYQLIYTGQHSETFDLLEQAFGTRPADDTIVPRFEADTHRGLLQWSVNYWRNAWSRVRSPEWTEASVGLVHGDTASTLFGAIALRMAGVPVAHVEAGLRSSRLIEPFPEEIIRRMVSRISELHLAPDHEAVFNLKDVRGHIVDTGGNTMRDALSSALLQCGTPAQGGEGGYGVVSMHRNENLSNKKIFDLLMEEVVASAKVTPLMFVLHPATRARLQRSGWAERLAEVPGLSLVPRMDYYDFVGLLLKANFLLTDGGSNQEEAAMLGLPTMLLRRTTERTDGLGCNVEISGLNAGASLEFVERHAYKAWTVLQQTTDSPSRVIVSELISKYGGR